MHAETYIALYSHYTGLDILQKTMTTLTPDHLMKQFLPACAFIIGLKAPAACAGLVQTEAR